MRQVASAASHALLRRAFAVVWGVSLYQQMIVMLGLLDLAGTGLTFPGRLPRFDGQNVDRAGLTV